MIIFDESTTIIVEIKEKLIGDINLVNLREVNYFLEIEITRNRQKRTITLNQKSYIQRLLNEFAKSLTIKPNPCALEIRLKSNSEKALESEIHSF